MNPYRIAEGSVKRGRAQALGSEHTVATPPDLSIKEPAVMAGFFDWPPTAYEVLDYITSRLEHIFR